MRAAGRGKRNPTRFVPTWARMARTVFSLVVAHASVAALSDSPPPTPSSPGTNPPRKEGTSDRKKVALALSGGGAYGLMYLGALEWMERHRIPVDAIAGTSGGALVGGWYATGIEMLSDEEIAHPVEPRSAVELRLRDAAPAIAQIDFEHVFDSGPDYRNLSMPQKRERARYANDLYAGLAGVRGLRRDGLVPGQMVGFFLDAIGRDYGQGFEGLPTPFRAVTVDAADSDPARWRTITLGGPEPEIPLGLSQAIRASIAVPFLFAPVEVGGHRLIDGAVRDNLPTDVAIDAFRPDVLIALRFDSGSGADAFRGGSRGAKPRETVLLTFDPRPYRVDQFARWRELAWIGYRGMAAHRTELERYALSPEAYAAYRRARRAMPVTHTVARVEGEVGGLEGVQAAVVGRDLDDMATIRRLGKALDRLVTDQGLATAGYDLRPGGLLRVRATRHRGGPSFARAALDLDFHSGDRPWLALRGRTSDLRSGHLGYALDGAMGTDPDISGLLEARVGRGLTVGPSFRVGRRTSFLFADGARRAEAAIFTAEAGVGLAYRPSRSLELSLTGRLGENNAADRDGAAYDFGTGAYRSGELRAELDTRDDPTVPLRGTRASLWARRTEADGGLWQSEGRLDLYREGWGFHAAFGTGFGNDPTFPFEFRPTVDGYRRDEVRGDGYGALAVSATRALLALPFALGRTFLVGRLENAWAGGHPFPAATVRLLADTRAGALTLGFGVVDRGAVRLFMGLGQRF